MPHPVGFRVLDLEPELELELELEASLARIRVGFPARISTVIPHARPISVLQRGPDGPREAAGQLGALGRGRRT